jgi:hypothetical protein
VTRPVRFALGHGVAEAFVADPYAAVLRVLQKASAALSATDIKGAWRTAGVPKQDADQAWPRVQRRLKSHDHVAVSGSGHEMTYRWTPRPAEPTASEALNILATGQLRSDRRQALADIVRKALDQSGDRGVVGRLEQKEKDAVRALAELAIEVEELATNQGSARAMIHRVRARTKLAALEPIGRAGETAPYDRKRHDSISKSVGDGSAVFIIRPGYVWKRPNGDIVVAKAVVQDRS